MLNPPNLVKQAFASDSAFKKYEDLFFDESGKLKDYFFPVPVSIDPADFHNAFQLGVICTPWTRRKSQWDLKLHFKKCGGLSVMRKVSETMRDWTTKYRPGERYPEKITQVNVSASPMYNDQIDAILTGIPGEQIEMCLATILRVLKAEF